MDDTRRPRLLEHDRPPGEAAPGPVMAGIAAVVGLGTVVMLGVLVTDSSETRLCALAGASVVATGSWRIIVTWHWYRGRRSAFERRS